MQDAPSFRTVHDGLLHLYISTTFCSLPKPAASKRLDAFRTIITSYLPDASILAESFRLEASSPLSEETNEDKNVVLKEIYEVWRRRDEVNSALAYAGWLIKQGKGKEAGEVVRRARAEVRDGERRQVLDEEWRKVLAKIEGGGVEPGESEEGEEEDIEMQD